MLFKTKSDKDFLETGRSINLLLNDLENLLSTLEKKLNNDYLLRYYDIVRLGLTDAKTIFGELAKLSLVEEHKQQLEFLNIRFKSILNEVEKIGTTQKKTVLEMLSLNTVSKKEELYQLFDELILYLSLNDIEKENSLQNFLSDKVDINWEVKGKILNSVLTTKQYSLYNSIIISLHEGDVSEIVDKLKSFISNQNYTMKEPFNSYERMSIMTFYRLSKVML